MILNSARTISGCLTVILIIGVYLSTTTNSFSAIVPKETPERFELEFWRAIKDSTDPAEFSAYLESFPQGKFAPLARIRLKAMKRNAAAKKSLPAKVPAQEPAKTPAVPDTPAASAETPQSPETQDATPTATVSPNNETTETAKSESADSPTKNMAPISSEKLTAMATNPFRDCTLCPEMIDVPPGEFRMGSDSHDATSAPEHTVRLDYPFSVGRFEVLHEQWDFCVSNGGCSSNSRNNGLDTNLPAINLSWKDAIDYVQWLASYTHRPYRLPTEAEWEYFARAGSDTNFWWGDEIIADSANCSECGGDWGRKLPAPVDAFASNNFGLVGTSGGVAEWVQDCWSHDYENAPADGSAAESGDCIQRVLRGGSWRSGAEYVNSANRLNYDHNVRYVTNGFRVVLDADDFMQ